MNLEGMDCTYGGFVSVYVNGFFVGTTSTNENTCKCGNGHCVDYPPVVYGGNTPLPGWVAGGDNTLTVVTSNGNQVCMHAASVTTSSRRTVPVVIYGSPLLDVRQIDPASLRFGQAQVVGTPVAADLDGDGLADLRAVFVGSQTGLSGSATSATVSGQFPLPLGGTIGFQGSDVVQVVNSAQVDVPCSASGYSGDNGCWYESALGASCNATCAGHGGFNPAGSQHTGNLLGRAFFPLKVSAGNLASVECSSVDNNTDWGATGDLPDGNYANPACYLACSCQD